MKKNILGRNSAGKFTKGNKCRSKSKKDLKRLVDEYCIHLSRGFNKRSFKGCDYRTVENNATVLYTEKIRVAKAIGFSVWDTIVTNLAFGITTMLPDGRIVTPKNCNTSLIIFIMKNKYYGLDKKRRNEDLLKKSDNHDTSGQSLSFTIIDPKSNQPD